MTARELRLHIHDIGAMNIIVLRKPYTVVEMRYGVYMDIGVAKCNPRDQWNETVGIALAKSRAVAGIADQIATHITEDITVGSTYVHAL